MVETEGPPKPPAGYPYEGEPRIKTFTLQASKEVGTGVELFGPEIDLIDTSEFQRLAGIKQLGTTNFVYRSAVHTRFDHSLGTLDAAVRLLRALDRNPRRSHDALPKEAILLARLGALLHDLPHITYGHTLEDEFGLLPRHDKDQARWTTLLTESEIGDILRGAIGNDLTKELVRVVSAKTEEDVANLTFPWIADLIGNTVCADLLDYTVRDLQACGMPVAVGERFLQYFIITPRKVANRLDTDSERMALQLEKRGMPRPDVESEVIKLLTYRYELAERVYFHHAKNAASVMIARGVQDLELEKLGSIAFLDLSDDLLLMILRRPEVADALKLGISKDKAARKRAKGIGEGLRSRRLYKLGYLGVYDDLSHRIDFLMSSYRKADAKQALEDDLTQQLELPAGHLLIHLPPKKMMMKAAEVRVLRSDGTVTNMEAWDSQRTGRVVALNQAHQRLWRVGVYVHPDTSIKSRREVEAVCADVFGAPSRFVLPKEPRGYPEGWRELSSLNQLTHFDRELVRHIAVADSYPIEQVDQAIGHMSQDAPRHYGGSSGSKVAPKVTARSAEWRAALGPSVNAQLRLPEVDPSE